MQHSVQETLCLAQWSNDLIFDNASLGVGDVPFEHQTWGHPSSYNFNFPCSTFNDTAVEHSTSPDPHIGLPMTNFLSSDTAGVAAATYITPPPLVPQTEFSAQIDGIYAQAGYSAERFGSSGIPNQLPLYYPHQFDWSTLGDSQAEVSQHLSGSGPAEAEGHPPAAAELDGQQISTWQEPAATFYSFDASYHSCAPTRQTSRAVRYAPYSHPRSGSTQRFVQTPSPSSMSSSASSASPHSPVITSPTAATATSSLCDGKVTFLSNWCWCGIKVDLRTGLPGEAMINHLRQFHGLPRLRHDTHVCPWEGCPKVYDNNSLSSNNEKSLRRHINSKHLGVKFYCRNHPRCPNVFARDDTRNRHSKYKCRV